MNVLYDYQIFELQKTGGISKYHADLYTEIKKKENAHVGIIYSDNLHLNEIGIKTKKTFSEEDVFLCKHNFKGKYSLMQWSKKMGLKLKSSHNYNAEYCRKNIINQSFDIFHPTYYNDLYSDIKIETPIVLTIHDMIYESFPHFFNDMSVIHKKKEWAKRANKIIAISEYTKKEILKYYNFIKEENIHVIYHGIKEEKRLNLNELNLKKENYILYVGERWGYKNFFTLLRALKILQRYNTDIKLYCVGRDFTNSEISYIDFLNVSSNVINFGRVSDAKLIELYSKSQLYVSTSMSEGFGLPLLECMKYSTPMILSDIPVYKEIAGDAAIYYSAMNENELAEKIYYVYNNIQIQKQLIEYGHIKCKMYSYQNTITKTLDTYNSLL